MTMKKVTQINFDLRLSIILYSGASPWNDLAEEFRLTESLGIGLSHGKYINQLIKKLTGLYINRIFNLVSLDNGAKMSPKRRTLLSLVFACICKSKN